MIEARLVEQGQNAKITKDGQLVVGDVDFSHFYLGTAIANDTAVNVVPPKTGKRFIITAIILSGDRSIAANGAVTDVYESDVGPTDGTIETQIIQEEIAKQTRMTATGLHIEVNQGKWVNVKSDDVIVRCNIAGYYVDA
jgi:phosphomannomutase